MWYHDVRQRIRLARKARRIRERFGSPEGVEESFLSQNGEDGIIRDLLFRVGFANRYFVEFGAGDGTENNAALLASRYGWRGTYIEANREYADGLVRRYGDNGRVLVLNELVTRDTICDLFKMAGVPEEFDLLSIDIDGNDYWIWSELGLYRPRVVVIEYNGTIPPPKRWVMAYNADHRWDGTMYFGASLESYAQLGKRLGYELICTDTRGVNAFFVRADLMERSGLRAATAAEAYHPLRFARFFGYTPPDGGRPFVEA